MIFKWGKSIGVLSNDDKKGPANGLNGGDQPLVLYLGIYGDNGGVRMEVEIIRNRGKGIVGWDLEQVGLFLCDK